VGPAEQDPQLAPQDCRVGSSTEQTSGSQTRRRSTVFSRPRSAVIASLVLALIVGVFAAGHLLNKLPIGLDPSAFVAGQAIQDLVTSFNPELNRTVAGIVWLVVALLVVGFVSFFFVHGAVRAKVADPERRTFLTGTVSGVGMALGAMVVATATGLARGLLGVGRSGGSWAGVLDNIVNAEVVTTHPEIKQAWEGSRVKAHRRFGRTDFQVSDIVLGTGRIQGEEGERIARLAIDRGINYFDTSPDYSGAGSENAMGKAIQGQRDGMFIATKFCTPTGHLPPGTPVVRYKEVIEESLGRLGTDYVDLVHIHSVDSVDRLMDPNVHEAFDRLEQDGKVRFLGFSSHTPNLVQVASAGIDSGRFDVMMLAYHHGMWTPMDTLIERARTEQDMGVVAMKTLKGAKHHGLAGFQEEEDAYSQAALKWVLSNPNVSCAVISFFEMQHVDEYLHASGGGMSENDLAVLRSYDQKIAGTHCQAGCAECLGACPEKLAINDVLRHRMYFEDYGWEKEGMRLYSQLEKNASVCASCSAPCLGTCPVGIPIAKRTREAHELLSLA
jgi:predicted aldo/keto reductase-like oxidoreductase